MTEPDTNLVHIEAFDKENGSRGTVSRNQGGYALTPVTTDAPVVRLKLEGSDDTMRYDDWSWQN